MPPTPGGETSVWSERIEGLPWAALPSVPNEIQVSEREQAGIQTGRTPMKEQRMYIGLGTLILVILILLLVF